MNRGYVKSWRKIRDWGWFKDVPVCHLFRFLIEEANHKDSVSFGVHVKRGQLITGRNKLAKQTGLSVQQVRTALKKLSKTGEISTKIATKQYTIITISDYETYQVDTREEQPSLQPTSNQGATKEQPLPKNVKNGKNKNISGWQVLDSRPEWISEKDFLAIVSHRRKHKAKPPETERAYKGIVEQLQKAIAAGYSLDFCLDRWLNNSSWQTFKLEYVEGENRNGETGRGVTVAQKLAEEMAEKRLRQQSSRC